MNIFRLFSRKDSNEPIYNFVEVEASDLKSYSNGLEKIEARSIDGFLIRNAFTENEVNTLVRVYEEVPEPELLHAHGGLDLYPKPFSYANGLKGYENAQKEYFEGCKAFWESVKVSKGIDIEARLTGLINQISGKYEIRIPQGPQNNGKFSIGNFRSVVPENGSFKPHCGNFFQREFPEIYDLVNDFSDPVNQFSYFLCIKKPKSGGELMLYNVLWKDTKVRMPNETTLQTDNGELIDLRSKKIKKQPIRAVFTTDYQMFSLHKAYYNLRCVRIR